MNPNFNVAVMPNHIDVMDNILLHESNGELALPQAMRMPSDSFRFARQFLLFPQTSW
jgi:hypothetical protein